MVPIATKEQIAKLLGESGRGSFAARRTAVADDLVLAVEGVGPIRLPITPAQAKRLAGTSRPARYGRREQTLLDRTIRDTGEIPARRVKIDQRRWNRTLRPILAALGSDLGLAPGQRLAATLHGMLVYGPGQFFKQHQDSERADGMVGTLVVTLPSSFTGGAIVVEHQGEVVAYRATKQPLAFIAFYADCRHEIRRVTAGYRIVLTYDLVLEGEATGNDAPARSIVDSLASLLRDHFTTPLPPSRWGREDAAPREPPNRLVYLLDHQYTERGLGWLRLKGSDAVRAAALRAAAESAGCEVALALAEIQETWGCMEEGWDDPWFASHRSWERDEDDEWSTDDEPPPNGPDAYELVDLQDSSITLQHWIDPRGRKAEAITTVSDEEVCATTPTSSLVPHAAEYEGYMGNYGNTMDRWYRRAALVLWPRERAFAVRAEASPGWALETIARCLNKGELVESRAMAKSLLAFWGRVAGRGDRRGLFAKVLRVAVGVEAPQLAEALLQPFEREAFTPGVARELAALVALYGEAWSRKLLGAWSRLQPAGAGRRDLLTWLASLPSFCRAATHARDDPAGTTAARLLLEDGWRALQQEIENRQSLEAASQRERALVELANPILGWLGGAAVVERSRPGETSIVAAVSYLCADSAALVPCLLKMLRASVRAMKPEARGMLGLDAIAKHCAEWLAAQLESPPRADDDWSIVPPATCRCALCCKLGAFLADRTLRRLEWPLAKEGRRHVHTVIDSQELPVRHETRRSGSPFTLVLEKSKTLFAQETAVRRAWQAELDWLAGAGWTTAVIGASRRRTKPRSASAKRARPGRSH